MLFSNSNKWLFNKKECSQKKKDTFNYSYYSYLNLAALFFYAYVIITKKANLDLIARRLIWGKVLNAGQTCVAPNYVFVDEEIKDELLFKIKAYLKEILGVNPLENPNYPRIISASHFNRLIRLNR